MRKEIDSRRDKTKYVMKYGKLPLIVMILLPIAASCGSGDDGGRNVEAEKLYEQTCRLARTYTDSIAKAPDSSSLEGIMARFDERLAELNFQVTAETDYQMSEGHNDTIALLLGKLRGAYDARLDSLGHTISLPDSLPAAPANPIRSAFR